MDLLIVIILATLAVLLVYRFVEQRHKVVLAKVMVAMLVLAGIGIGGLAWFLWSQEAAEAKLLGSVTVEFLDDDDAVAQSLLRELRTGMPRADTLQELSFRICNNWESAVELVVFEPKTFRRGRSTPRDMVVPEQRRLYEPVNLRANHFASDVILTPSECTSLSWTGGVYLVLDSVRIAVLEVVPSTP